MEFKKKIKQRQRLNVAGINILLQENRKRFTFYLPIDLVDFLKRRAKFFKKDFNEYLKIELYKIMIKEIEELGGQNE